MINRRANALLIFFCMIAIAALGLSFSFTGGGFSAAAPAYASAVFDRDTIMTIEITVNPAEWRDMLDNAEDKPTIHCDLMVNGYTARFAGIRTKGNSSLYNSRPHQRHSFKIKLNEYFSKQNLLGLDEFVLNNTDVDPTWMKEYISYLTLERLGVKTPLYAFARVYVNGEYWGLYLAVEAMHTSYAVRSFGADYGQLYKVEYVEVTDDEYDAAPADALGLRVFGADLLYTDDDPSHYQAIFERKEFKKLSDSDKLRVIQALKGINDPTKDISRYLEVDPTLRYIAGNAMLGNDDGYFGSMFHNFYLREHNGKLTMLPWDYNTSFGGFGRDGADVLINVPIHEPFTSYVTLEERPLVARLFADSEYLSRYDGYLRQAAEWYAGDVSALIDDWDARLREWIEKDLTKEYDMEQHNASVAMLKRYIELRGRSVLRQLDGDLAPVDASGIDLYVINGASLDWRLSNNSRRAS